jgi:hypothetical protein
MIWKRPHVRAGPTREQQGACRDFDSLVALFLRYVDDPFLARRRAQHVLDGRARRAETRGRFAGRFKDHGRPR